VRGFDPPAGPHVKLRGEAVPHGDLGLFQPGPSGRGILPGIPQGAMGETLGIVSFRLRQTRDEPLSDDVAPDVRVLSGNQRQRTPTRPKGRAADAIWGT
jgi:hypothetical protein